MKNIPCYLTVFNLLAWPRAMAAECERLGLRVILLDNGSTYPPCVEWLRRCPYDVIHVGSNAGCYGFFHSRRHHQQDGYFVVSDSDLDLSGVPSDAVDCLIAALEANPDATKAGLSLEINDVDSRWPLYDAVLQYESDKWQQARPSNCFWAEVGATFAVYSSDRAQAIDEKFYQAVRLDRPYTARHLPWYLDLESLDEEQRFFFEHCDNVAYYSSRIKQRLQTVTV